MNQMDQEVFVFKIGKATVRIHPGKRTEEERKEAFEQAAQQFCKAVMKKHPDYFRRRM